ncbi:hypothetical protein [Marinomonas sp. 2405UD68-3]|uniref:hypothetical protein n=1 Tax=Marinomonas sp. 2405UD68-3 TaxID=3391835 RepID=UPI0039C93D12
MDISLKMASQRAYQKSELISQRTIWRPEAETDETQTQQNDNQRAALSFSAQQVFTQLTESSSSIQSQERAPQPLGFSATQELGEEMTQDPRIMKTKSLIEKMFGISFTLYKHTNTEQDESADDTQQAVERFDSNGRLLEQVQQSYHELKEMEHTSFQASGSMVLQDGRQFNINFSLDMSRSREESFYGEVIISGRQVDPLTINLNGNMAQLSNNKMQFDINNDGEMDEVSYAIGDSAFLAIDKNGNGSIDDGGELFGPESGSGFTDLAQHDDNQDGIIDSLDTIFDQLVLTQRDEAGNETLISLEEAGIEAFLLSSQDTQFSLFNPDGERTGIIQETGLYIKSDGSVDSMQHVDLIV